MIRDPGGAPMVTVIPPILLAVHVQAMRTVAASGALVNEAPRRDRPA